MDEHSASENIKLEWEDLHVIDNADKQFPFLDTLQEVKYSERYPREVILSSLNDTLLGWRLVEDESHYWTGHPNVHHDVFMVKNGILEGVPINRRTMIIYPVQYLHPGSDFPDDVHGESETLG